MIPEHNKDSPTQTSVEDDFPAYQYQSPLRQPWVRWSLVILALIAIAVFFWLPSYVEKPQITTEEVFSKASNNNYATDASPWLDAQLAKQRKAAQQILAKLLDLQFALEEKSVRQWAETDFKSVEAFAVEGDNAYRSKNFIDSAKYYQLGLDKLQELDSSSTQVLNKLLSQGQVFFLQKDSINASQKFQLALAIDPENKAALKGLRRSETLDQVLALQTEALKHYQAGNLDQALAVIDKALSLDEDNTQSIADHSIYSLALTDQQYSEAMSQGYNALLKKQYANAESFFRQAARLKPGSSQASTALQNTADKQSLERVNKLHQQAKALEADELWSTARERYEAALKLDNNLIFARVGAIRSKAREELDNKIENALKAPQRLNDQIVFRNTEDLLKDAQSIQQPGKKLLLQIKTLQTTLAVASQDVLVSFRSDNKTNVRIQRIGQLGSFESQQLNLKPGVYIATGSRPGFRDVRLEFTVSAASPRTIIAIECNEPI